MLDVRYSMPPDSSYTLEMAKKVKEALEITQVCPGMGYCDCWQRTLSHLPNETR